MVLINPRAGLLNTKNSAPEVERILRRALKHAAFHVTETENEADQALRRAVAQQFRRVIVAGGDGTVHHAARILAGTNVELGLIPLGSANNIAGSLRIPDKPRNAMRLAAGGRAHPIDIGRCGRHIFLEAAGIGFHAHVLKIYSRSQSKSLVRSAYAIVRTGIEMEPLHVTLTADGARRRHVISQMTISNLPMYGANFKPSPHARPDDGLLDVVLVPYTAAAALPVFVAALRAGTFHTMPGVITFSCNKLEIETQRPAPLHLDADASFFTPATIQTHCACLKIVRPATHHAY